MAKVKLGDLVLTVENLDEVIPNRNQYEQWDSYDGSYQVKMSANQIKEVSFKTSIRTNKEHLLESINGKRILASSDLFKPFECVVTSQKYSVDGGEVYAVYEITLKEDKVVPQ